MGSWIRFIPVCMICCLWNEISGQDFGYPVDNGWPHATTAMLPRSFTYKVIREAFQVAIENIARKKRNPPRKKSSTNSWNESPSDSHNYFQKSKPRSKKLKTCQETFEETTKILREKYDLNSEQIILTLADIDLEGIIPDDSMKECTNLFNVNNCSKEEPYRSFDGTCNNLENSSWGMASSCFQRLLDPVYADGISKMRTAVSGHELPSPRTISLKLHSHVDNPNPHLTHMFMQWGQFITHDITLSPLEQQDDNQPLDCCPMDKNNSLQCAPILLERKDPFFSPLKIDCLNNARTMMCPTCSLGPRQQINQVTAFIDGSMIYGTSRNDSNLLRHNDGSGTLRSVIVDDSELLPPSSTPDTDRCTFQMPNQTCFQGGDSRVNQHNALTSLHIIWMRHHNRMAKKLQILNKKWSDEIIFQETRSIIGAQLQMITYNEFLPLVFGRAGTRWYDLDIREDATYTQYDSTVQPSLFNEFSTAAFRFGHSTINSFFSEISKPVHSGKRLRDLFIWPFDLYHKGYLESVLRGLFQSPVQNFDRHIVQDVTNHLYQFRGNQSGLDLAALNILRGRDHGLPPYVEVVHFCGGPTITTFHQLERLFQKGYRQRFQSVYRSVEDIDLFSGGLAEKPSRWTVVGPTFTCILGIQFYHLKYGDRFYFEHGGQAGSFTSDQLREIKKISLAKVICENSEIDQLQKRVMFHISEKNTEMKCKDLPDIDLRFWAEKSV